MWLGNLTREAERGALIRCLSHPTWLHSMQSRGGSIDDQASHPILGQKPRRFIFWPLVFMISFLQLLPTAFDHRWTEESLSTGKFRAFRLLNAEQVSTSVRSWFIMSEVRVWQTGVQFVKLRIRSLPFTGEIVLLSSQGHNLPISLLWFVAKSEVFGIKNQLLQIRDYGYGQPEKGGGTTPGQG